MTMTHPFIDFLIVTCSALVSCFFMTRTLPTFQLFLFFFVPVAVTLCCSKTYRVYWLRAGLYNYWHLAIMLGMGSVVSILLLYVFKFPYLVNDYGTNHTRFVSGAMLFVLFNIVLVELERFMLNYAENFLFRKLYLQYQPVDRVLKTLVYGGGAELPALHRLSVQPCVGRAAGGAGRNALTTIRPCRASTSTASR